MGGINALEHLGDIALGLIEQSFHKTFLLSYDKRTIFYVFELIAAFIIPSQRDKRQLGEDGEEKKGSAAGAAIIDKGKFGAKGKF